MCWGDVQLMKDTDETEYLHFSERYQQASQKFKENNKTVKFKKQVSTETSVIFS